MDYQPVIRHALWRTPDFECKKGKNQEFLLNLIVNMLNDTRFMEKMPARHYQISHSGDRGKWTLYEAGSEIRHLSQQRLEHSLL